MPSDVSICKNALILVGAAPISALSENETVEAIYPDTYRDFLSLYPWKFATKKSVSLSRLTAAPADSQYKYAFQLPSDCILVDHPYPANLNYDIYGRQLYANVTEIQIDYRFQASEGNMPPYCVTALEYLLASKFAIPITSNKSTAKEYREAYEGTDGRGGQLKRAKFTDAKQAPQDQPAHQPFIAARQG